MMDISRQNQQKAFKLAVLGVILIFCVIIILYINIYRGVEIVYTHLFYLPIIFSGIWYHRKALIIAAFLGGMHIYAGYAHSGTLNSSAFIRAAMFLVVAYVVGHISEKKDMFYENLKMSTYQNNLVLQAVGEGIFSVDLDGRVLFANSAAIKLILCRSEEISAGEINLTGCLKPLGETEEGQECPVQQTLMEGLSCNTTRGTFLDRTGISIPVEYNCTPIREHNLVIGAVVVIKDITGRIKVENEMARLDRLNLIGKMAASLAHEVRNPMTTVRGFLQMFMNKDENVKRDYIDLMIEEMDRANSIITEFLSLGKNRIVNPRVQSLTAIVQAISHLIVADAVSGGKQIKIELGEVPELLLDDNEIRQLILNLVNNGLEATSIGGEVTISTGMEDEDIVLAVKDNGSGIEPGVLDRMGTPFFTTKETGTGLGLAVCYSIAARHNAVITVNTSPSGTTFFVKFQQNK